VAATAAVGTYSFSVTASDGIATSAACTAEVIVEEAVAAPEFQTANIPNVGCVETTPPSTATHPDHESACGWGLWTDQPIGSGVQQQVGGLNTVAICGGNIDGMIYVSSASPNSPLGEFTKRRWELQLSGGATVPQRIRIGGATGFEFIWNGADYLPVISGTTNPRVLTNAELQQVRALMGTSPLALDYIC